jgi:hypothetical protein
MQTITEALAEIATIDKRIPKKAADLVPYVARPEQVKDPFEKSGGSAKYLREQRQSHADLLLRKINLRAAIARANAETMIAIGGQEMSVADWLVWKRECYGPENDLLKGLLAQAQYARNQAQQKGVMLVKVGDASSPDDIIVNLDEQALIADAEALQEKFGLLDGLLSLKNATVTIDV